MRAWITAVLLLDSAVVRACRDHRQCHHSAWCDRAGSCVPCASWRWGNQSASITGSAPEHHPCARAAMAGITIQRAGNRAVAKRAETNRGNSTSCSSGFKGDLTKTGCGTFCKSARASDHCHWCKCRDCSFCVALRRAKPARKTTSLQRHTSGNTLNEACAGEPIGKGCAVVLYTVIFGRQAEIQPPFGGFPEGCAIMITNEASNAQNGWQLHRPACLDRIGNQSEVHPRMVSRWWKINSMRFFDVPTIYTDVKERYNASTWLRSYSNVHAEVLTACKASFAVFEHPQRPNHLVEEFAAVIAQKRTHTVHACSRYLSRTRNNSAFRSAARVLHASFLVRQPSRQLATLENAWWDAYGKGCDRDQPALSQALFQLYGSSSLRCGHDVHILAHDGIHHQSWSDASSFCHPLAQTCS